MGLNFQAALTQMVTYLQGIGSKITDFTKTSVINQILSSVATVNDSLDYSITVAANNAFVSTADDTGLDKKGLDLNVPRKLATPSIWSFNFVKNQISGMDVNIPQGTIITSIPQPGISPVTFATNVPIVLTAGQMTVAALATCQSPGVGGNIAPGTPLVIGSAVPGMDGVTLTTLVGGTVGVDKEATEPYRARLLAAPASKAQGTIAWYTQTALGVTGVNSAKVNPQGRGAGTVDVFVVGVGNSLPSSPLIAAVQAAIDAGRIITDDAQVFAPTAYAVTNALNIKVATGYDLTATATSVKNAVAAYINGLGIGGGNFGALYQSQVAAVALNVPGVLNVPPLATPLADIVFSSFQLPQTTTGDITVTPSY